MAAFFIGTLAISFVGIGFTLGVVAIVVGFDPGLACLPPTCARGARAPGWRNCRWPGCRSAVRRCAGHAHVAVHDRLGRDHGIFGAQALQLLLHVPFWLGLLIILALQGLIGVFGYEVLHTYQKWMAVILGIMFVILSFKISSIGSFSAPASAHGAALAGGFVLMVTSR